MEPGWVFLIPAFVNLCFYLFYLIHATFFAFSYAILLVISSSIFTILFLMLRICYDFSSNSHRRQIPILRLIGEGQQGSLSVGEFYFQGIVWIDNVDPPSGSPQITPPPPEHVALAIRNPLGTLWSCERKISRQSIIICILSMKNLTICICNLMEIVCYICVKISNGIWPTTRGIFKAYIE